MKPIAVVYWQYDGTDRLKNCFDQSELYMITRKLRDNNYVFVTCICSLNVNLPFVSVSKARRAI